MLCQSKGLILFPAHLLKCLTVLFYMLIPFSNREKLPHEVLLGLAVTAGSVNSGKKAPQRP